MCRCGPGPSVGGALSTDPLEAIAVPAHPLRRTVALAALAAAALGVSAAPANATEGIYGGTTRGGEALVLRTDKAGTRVRSAVVAWSARCDNGSLYHGWTDARAVKRSPVLDRTRMVMRRNRAGRFRGEMLSIDGLGEHYGSVEVTVEGRLRRGRASGTLRAEAQVFDAAAMELLTSCRTGPVRWTAARDAGRIFAGATSQDEPFVARFDGARSRVTDVFVGWHTHDCAPPAALRLGDNFVNFAVDRRGRWGGAFDHEEALDDGSRMTLDYAFRGTLRRTSARGTLSVGFRQADAAGTETMSCKTGTIRWTAATG
jgi:hypothetical protein